MITKSDLCRVWEEKLGYTFEKSALLEQALTHRSYANERGLTFGNETLALLGDTILQFFVTTQLFSETPTQRPGFLTERRKSFVCEETLSEKAKKIGLGDAILFGRGEGQQGGALKPSHLSEALEAVIGAIYLDGGLKEAIRFLSTQFEEFTLNLEGPHER